MIVKEYSDLELIYQYLCRESYNYKVEGKDDKADALGKVLRYVTDLIGQKKG